MKTLTVSFAKLGITTTEGRVTWARGKADELAARTKALQSGATPRLDMPIAAALEKYFELVAPTGNPDIDDIRPETVLIYRAAARCFAEWCVANKAPTAGAVSEWHLQHWRASRITAKHERTGKARSRFSARKEVAAMRTILLHLRKVKIVALSKEQINDGLNNVEAKAKKKGFLYPDDIKLLLEAADAHDADVASRPAAGNRTIRFAALGAFVRVVLFTGARVNEIITLEWRDVDLQHGKIHLRPENVKTGDARTVDLLICPSVVALLKALRAKLAGAEPTARVFPSATTERAQCARQRLIKHHKAPTFSWHMLRRTTGTYLTCAPSIFGAASAWMSSQRLGHGVGVAESSYVGRVDVPASARTLEQAFGLAP